MAELAVGILNRTKKGEGILLDPARPWEQVFVPARLVKRYQIVEGATVQGPIRAGDGRKEIGDITSISGLDPDEFQRRIPFPRLVAISPDERFRLADSGEMTMRMIDLMAPIGKGTRGLIVSPPKSGKTMLLEQIATSVHTVAPETRIVMMLVDERPEEVTHFRRSVSAEVFASSADQSQREHVELTELMLAHIRTELECGHDIVVLVDSLTRMTRTFNLKTRSRGRSLSGGLEAGAVEIPRRFFGLARNVEDGGSVTILATVLVDTGSRLDQVIFEEFKGTGNSEIVLDRALAEARIFPALNLAASGTRRIELLYDEDDTQRIAGLRRMLASQQPKAALQTLMRLLDKYPTNEDLLRAIPGDA